MFKTSALTALLLTFPLAAVAHDGVHVVDAYARVATPMAQTAAAFMVIENHSAEEDRLVSATSDVAARAELHTHTETAEGVMQMGKVEGGFVIPGSADHVLDRGGDHVMMLGLNRPLKQGDVITLTLTFARGDVVTVEVPVDNDRAPSVPTDHGGHSMDHGN